MVLSTPPDPSRFRSGPLFLPLSCSRPRLPSSSSSCSSSSSHLHHIRSISRSGRIPFAWHLVWLWMCKQQMKIMARHGHIMGHDQEATNKGTHSRRRKSVTSTTSTSPTSSSSSSSLVRLGRSRRRPHTASSIPTHVIARITYATSSQSSHKSSKPPFPYITILTLTGIAITSITYYVMSRDEEEDEEVEDMSYQPDADGRMRPLPSSSPSSSPLFIPKCGYCDMLLSQRDGYVTTLGHHYCQHHFICYICHINLYDKEYFLSHDNCLVCMSHISPVCCICHATPPAQQRIVTSRGDVLCRYHTSSQRCSSCSSPLTSSSHRIDDRIICSTCYDVTIPQQHMLSLWTQMHTFLSHITHTPLPAQQQLSLVTTTDLARYDDPIIPQRSSSYISSTQQLHPPYQHIEGMTVKQIISTFPGRTYPTISHIMIVRHLTYLHTGSVMLHELMHAWCHLNGITTRMNIEEGICELVAYIWLSYQVTAPAHRMEAQMRMKRIERSPVWSPVYASYRGRSLSQLLSHIRTHGELPTPLQQPYAPKT